MSHQRFMWAKQSEGIVNGRIRRQIRVEFSNPVDFVTVFRQMGLDGKIVCFTEAAEAGHQLFCRRRDESRRCDEANAVQFFAAAEDELFRIG